MSKMREEKQEKEFNKVFPCIQPGCSNDGIIPEQDEDGDSFPTQCEFCYKIRFPVKEWIESQLSLAHSQGVKEERERIVKKIDYLLNEKLHSKQGIHNFDLEFNNGLKAAKQIINSLTPEKEEE